MIRPSHSSKPSWQPRWHADSARLMGYTSGAGTGGTTYRWLRGDWISLDSTFLLQPLPSSLNAPRSMPLDSFAETFQFFPAEFRYSVVIAIQSLQHGKEAATDTEVKRALGRVEPGGLFCIRVNAAGTVQSTFTPWSRRVVMSALLGDSFFSTAARPSFFWQNDHHRHFSVPVRELGQLKIIIAHVLGNESFVHRWYLDAAGTGNGEIIVLGLFLRELPEPGPLEVNGIDQDQARLFLDDVGLQQVLDLIVGFVFHPASIFWRAPAASLMKSTSWKPA